MNKSLSTYQYNNQHISYSRINRKNQTDTEKLLWFKLRSRQLEGYKFVRQFPISKYILDFYCREKMLAIELDGSQHNIQKNYDQKRSAYLRSMGIYVLRFWDNDVLQNMNGVLQKIVTTLRERPHPDPLLKGEGK